MTLTVFVVCVYELLPIAGGDTKYINGKNKDYMISWFKVMIILGYLFKFLWEIF